MKFQIVELLITILFLMIGLVNIGCKKTSTTFETKTNSNNSEANKYISEGANNQIANQSEAKKPDSEIERVYQIIRRDIKKDFEDAEFGKITQMLQVDFDGDGKQDYAIMQDGTLLAKQGRKTVVFVSVVLAPFKTDSESYFEVFGIDAGCQQCICELENEPLSIDDLDFKTIQNTWKIKLNRATKAKGLYLNGGGCDGIHLFWIPKTKQLGWWRL